jgi:hypothetical protein
MAAKPKTKSIPEYPDFDKMMKGRNSVSFGEMIAPFYGKAMDTEVASARQAATTGGLVTSEGKQGQLLTGVLKFLDLSKLADPTRMTQQIPISTVPSSGSDPARANYNRVADSIDMGEKFKYGTGKPRTFQMSGDGGTRSFTAPASSSYGQVLSHEIGHSMYPAASGMYNVSDQTDAYFDMPAEMATELAHAQRQNFQQTGQRFTEKSFLEFIEAVKKDPKAVERFAPSTQKALRHYSTLPQVEQTEAAKILPMLVMALQQKTLA